jgi:transposase
MQAVTTIGLDIAKSVFQIHGVDAEGNVVVRRQLKRRHIVAFFQKLPRRWYRGLRIVASLGKVRADRINHCSPLPNEEMPSAMEHQAAQA